MARNDFGLTFNGRTIIHPGAYDYIDASSMVVTSTGSVNIPIIVGEAEAGIPGEVKWFSRSEDASSYLEGGDLLHAVDMMFSPAPEGGGGASNVGVLITNTTTPATLSSGGLTQTSITYGQSSNKIQTKLEDGTISGTKKFTAYKWDTEEMEVYDNLGAIMQLKYTGEEAYANLSITAATEESPALLVVKIGEDEASAAIDVQLELSLDKYPTVDSLVRYFMSMSGYDTAYVSYESANLPITEIDPVASVDLKSVSYIKAVDGDLVYRINKYSKLVTVELTSTLTNYEFKYLTGGSKGASPASWSTYFTAIKKQFSDILVVLTSSISIQAEAMMHVSQMETRNQKQVMFTGGALGETTAQIVQRATTFNSSRAVVAYPGVYYKPVNSGQTALPSYMTAAMIAGRVAGVDPAEPITFDYFNIIALEKDLLAGDPDVDELISSGVCTLERVQNGGIRLAQGVTTYTGANNVLYREICVRRGADTVSERMRKTMEETFVGKKGTAIPSSIRTKAIEVLDQAVKDKLIVAYGTITIRQVGTVIYIDYEVAPIEPINFVLVTSHFVPEITSTTETNS